MSWTFWMKFSAIFGATGVMAGAFGAHALKDKISQEYLAVFETAARYQMYHALALMGIGMLALRVESTLLKIAGIFMILGVLLFSGSLYALAMTSIKPLGMITPLGGLFLIIAWILIFVSIWAL